MVDSNIDMNLLDRQAVFMNAKAIGRTFGMQPANSLSILRPGGGCVIAYVMGQPADFPALHII